MKKIYFFVIAAFFLTITLTTRAQAFNIKLSNDGTSTIDLFSIQSIVFSNNNIIVNKSECWDNYFSIFYAQKIYFNESVDILDNEPELNSVSFYPNPADDFIVVDKKSESVSQMQIYSITGSLVLSGSLNDSKNSVDISSLLPGIYFMVIDNEHFKFIKK